MGHVFIFDGFIVFEQSLPNQKCDIKTNCRIDSASNALKLNLVLKKRVTLRQIAEKAGVHFTTVGLALRNDSRVNAETAERVQRVAKELGYTKDAMLSALSSYRRSPQRFAGVIGYLTTQPVRDYIENNPRGKLVIDAARDHAESLGFGLEAVQVNGKGFTPQRMTSILQSRGIMGLVVPPVTSLSGPFTPLDWEEFAPVALNYSITSPSLHRVCYNHMHAMTMHLKQLRDLGYKRIGISITLDMNVRTGWHWLGAFLAEQKLMPASCSVAPLLVNEVTEERLISWVEHECPDAIVVMEPEMVDWVRSAGWKVPDDLGVSLFSVEDEESGFSGIHEQSDILGAAAVDFVVSMIVSGERGVPRFPRYSMIDARWVEGSTTRQQ